MSNASIIKALPIAWATTLLSTTAFATEITFYYPVAVTGQLSQLIDDLCARFHKENPDITVKPVFSGNYADTLTKSLTAAKGGQPPQIAVLAASDIFTVIDEDVVTPISDIATEQDKAWLEGFMPVYMRNLKIEDKTWGVPFQRSVQVLLYNKDKFKDAGLDPNKAPANWDELVEAAKKLTVTANGTASQWGLLIPSGYTARWYYNALSIPAGATLTNETGTEVNLTSPEAISALQFLGDLSQKHKVMPSGIVNTGTAPDDFIGGRAAMLYASTGNIGNIRTQAKFNLGIGLIPASKVSGAPTGGGNMFVFKDSTPEQKAASLRFIKWMTSAENAAEWSIATGYVAPRQDAWETAAMKAHIEKNPDALTVLKQLETAQPEFSTRNGPRVTKALEDAIAQVVTGQSDAETALKRAQTTAEGLLRSFK